MKIASRSSWKAQQRDGVGSRPVGNLEKYLHHSVTRHLSENASVNEERVQCRVLESIGQQRFKGGISYNILIFPSGRVYWGASINRIAYHSGAGRNTRGVGIVLVGNYQAKKLGKKARESLIEVLVEGVMKGWWTDAAITEGHRDFRSTSCPGVHAYSEIISINREARARLKARRAGKPAPKPKPLPAARPAPKPTGKAWPHVALKVGGKHTVASHNAWVKLLGDVGYRHERLTRNLQTWLRQLGYYKGRIDGIHGPMTARALQTFLKRRGFYKGKIDGVRGPVTIRAEMAYLNSQRKYY